MDRQLAEQWYKDLLSGEYKQTSGALHRYPDGVYTPDSGRPEGYCCLGVLCESAKKLPEFQSFIPKINNALISDSSLHHHESLLVLFNILRIDEAEFIGANDHIGKTFPEIAEMVKEKYLGETKPNE